MARELETTFDAYPHWRVSAAQERGVRRAIYRVLLKSDATKPGIGESREINELTELVERLIRVAGRAGDVE